MTVPLLAAISVWWFAVPVGLAALALVLYVVAFLGDWDKGIDAVIRASMLGFAALCTGLMLLAMRLFS